MSSECQDTIEILETNLDDCSPEILGYVMEKLLEAGAYDFYFQSIGMKKNRPATLLSVMVELGQGEKFAEIIFAETTAFGLRRATVQRWKLERAFRQVSTVYGEVLVKLGYWKGKLVQISPEFESCRAIAKKNGVPLQQIYEAARAVVVE